MPLVCLGSGEHVVYVLQVKPWLLGGREVMGRLEGNFEGGGGEGGKTGNGDQEGVGGGLSPALSGGVQWKKVERRASIPRVRPAG